MLTAETWTLADLEASGYRPSPFGLDECCICDEAAAFVIPEAAELLPYCERDAVAIVAEFPDLRVYRIEG